MPAPGDLHDERVRGNWLHHLDVHEDAEGAIAPGTTPLELTINATFALE